MTKALTFNNLLNAIIPISRFNKGEASKIFEEVVETGIKIVMKNNKPACVLISPEEYQKIVDEAEDYILLKEALQRLHTNQPDNNISQEALLKELGITPEQINEVEVDIE